MRYYTPEIVKILVKAGANLELKENEGYTALMMSVFNQDYGVKNAEILIDAGADINNGFAEKFMNKRDNK